MKFGFRKPNIKKSISARTKGKVTRTIKKAINPTYNKKGMGLINDPKKSIYNSIYNKTTVSINPMSSSSSLSNKKASSCSNNIFKSSGYKYVNVDDRSSIYANSSNTYTSPKGRDCIEYEKSLINRLDNYTKCVCPYCNSKIDIRPQRAKKCKICGNKIYIANSGIGKGTMYLTKDESDKLHHLKKLFYEDRNNNPYYK